MRRLTAADIYDAMKNLRTYFTGTPGFRVMYSIDGKIQGSIIDWTDDLTINVKASCDDECRIGRIDVYGEGGVVIDTAFCNDSVIDKNIRIKQKQKYYFLKLTREDRQIAVTAPIWIK